MIALTEGFYSTSLGLLKPLPLSVFDGSVLFLELSVGGVTMSPRQRISSVAYALVSQSVSGGSVNASSLTVANTPVVYASGKLNPATIAPGSVPRDRLERLLPSPNATINPNDPRLLGPQVALASEEIYDPLRRQPEGAR